MLPGPMCAWTGWPCLDRVAVPGQGDSHDRGLPGVTLGAGRRSDPRLAGPETNFLQRGRHASLTTSGPYPEPGRPGL